MKSKWACYGLALGVIVIWSLTFISTKVLLRTLNPVEILIYRYALAYAALFVLYPHVHRPRKWKEELWFASAGLCGGTLYFLAENYALSHTLASNVGLLLAAAPLFTALAAHCFTSNEPFTRRLALGSALAFAGVFLVIGNGHFVLRLQPLGDLLALSAAGFWAAYSIVIKKIGGRHNGLYVTRKVFFYTLLTLLPALALSGFKWQPQILTRLDVLCNLLFLGVLASSISVWVWNWVIWHLGAVTTTNFVYLVPLCTLLAAAVVLDEPVTWGAVLGGILIVAGVFFAGRPAKTSAE